MPAFLFMMLMLLLPILLLFLLLAFLVTLAGIFPSEGRIAHILVNPVSR